MPIGLNQQEASLSPAVSWWPDPVSADSTGSVLVAAGDPELRRRIGRPLTERGFVVVEAAGPGEALELARRFRVDVAIVDSEGLGLDQPGFLHRWREACDVSYVPVLLFSAHSGPDEVGKGILLGAHDYLRPPLADVDVLARVFSARAAKRRYDEFGRRVTELQQLVLTDPLTGLYNRRHIQAELAALASAARRQQTPLGVLLVDVDRFKRINDRLSHEAGDTALRTVAGRIQSVVRAEDVVGRWGGDEFVVLLPSTDQAAAVVLAQRLCREVAKPGRGVPALPLTVSIGCAAAHQPDEAALISAADAALHRAKAQGRNRVGV